MTSEINAIKELLKNVYDACDMIENEVQDLMHRLGYRNNLKNILEEDLIKYLVYIMHSEGIATYYYETLFMNDVLEANFTFNALNNIYKNENLNNKLFATNKSFILTIFIKAAEKYVNNNQPEKAKYILDKIYSLFRAFGYGLYTCTDGRSPKRKLMLKKYINNMENDVNLTFKNLKIGYTFKDGVLTDNKLIRDPLTIKLENRRTQIIADIKSYMQSVYDFCDRIYVQLKDITQIPDEFSQMKDLFKMDTYLFICFIIGTRGTYNEEEIRFLNESLDYNHNNFIIKDFYENHIDTNEYKNNLLSFRFFCLLSQNLMGTFSEKQCKDMVFLLYNSLLYIKKGFFEYIILNEIYTDNKISKALSDINILSYKEWYNILHNNKDKILV